MWSSILICRNFCRSPFLRHHSSVATFLVKDILSIKPLNTPVLLRGWVQAVRKHKDLVFVDLTDGSSLDRLQIVIQPEENKPPPSYGSSISVQGMLVKSEHKGQDVELCCEAWHIIGFCPEDYPFLARHHHSADYVRQLQHLRPKTKLFKSVLHVRNAASMAVHNFFQDRDFLFVHTPIITLNDCEGGGDVFYIEPRNKAAPGETVERAVNEELLNGKVLQEYGMEQIGTLNTEKPSEKVSEKSVQTEFFKYPACLTVSGQFHLEAMTGALPRVYNFGPTFRAERNHTSCHLSEFSMVEAELAFIDCLDELTNLVECLIKNLVTHVMETCSREIDWISETYTQNHKDYLTRILSAPFLSMSYSEAVEILEKHRKSLTVQIKWGEDLLSEHKRFIIQHCNNTPVFITGFPASIKPFYMKVDSDGKGLCFDLLAPFGNEICSGSLREENLDVMKKHFETLNVTEHAENTGENECLKDPGMKASLGSFSINEISNDAEVIDPLAWYLDIRKYGSIPHGGFGIGFDRTLQTILGIPNIRDVVPFPRWSNHCKC